MRSRWAVALVAMIALAGCGEDTGDTRDDGDTGAANGDGAPRLAGEYVVTGVTEGGDARGLVSGTQARLTFDEGTLGIQAGCNHLSGDYTLDGDRLTVGPIGGTEMGCPQDRMDQDTWLAGLFAEPVTVAEGPLTLTAGDVVLTLAEREAVSPDAAVTGTRWVLDGFVDGDAASSVPGGVEAWLMITDGRARVMPGCNTGQGDVTVAGDTLDWGPLGLTRMACPGDRGEVERRVLSVLDGHTAYTIEEHSLTITKGEHGLTFRAG